MYLILSIFKIVLIVKSMSKTEIKIMTDLALHGEGSRYQISKETGISYSMIHKWMDELQSKKLVKVSKTITSKRNPHINVEYYQLTNYGLLKCLLDEEIWEHIDTIAERFHDWVPLIFGKWTFFEEHGIKEQIISQLKTSIPTLHYAWEIMTAVIKQTEIRVQMENETKEKENIVKEYVEEIVKSERPSCFRDIMYSLQYKGEEGRKERVHAFAKTVFNIYNILEDMKSLKPLLLVLREDDELRAFITKSIDEVLIYYHKLLKNLVIYKAWWKEELAHACAKK